MAQLAGGKKWAAGGYFRTKLSHSGGNQNCGTKQCFCGAVCRWGWGVGYRGGGVIAGLKEICAVGFLVLGAVGCYQIGKVLLFPVQHFSLCGLLSASTMISYFLAGGISLWLSSTDALLVENIAGELDLLSALVATLYIIAYCGILSYLGAWERPGWRHIIWRAQNEPLNRRLALYVISAIVVAKLYIMYTGGWGYGGYQVDQADESGALPPFVALVAFFGTPALGMIGWVIGRNQLRPTLTTVILLGMIGLELLWSIGLGRRFIVFQLVVLMTMYFLGQGPQKALGQIIKGGIIALIVVAPLWLMYYSMRVVYQSAEPDDRETTVVSHLRSAMEETSAQSGALIDDMASNVSTRLYIMGYFASLVARADQSDPALGLGVIGDVIEAIPGVMFHGKQAFHQRYGRVEDLVNPRFNLEARDEANSLVTASFGDFLWAGCLIYPILIFGVARLVIFMVAQMRNPLLLAYCLSYMIITFVLVEAALTDYLLPLRVLAVVLVLAWMTDRRLAQQAQCDQPAANAVPNRP